MVEPDGIEGQQEAPEAGPVSEGEEREGSSGSALGERVQAFRGSATSTGGLDTQVMQDEPEQLMRLLLKTAQQYEGPRHRAWGIIARYASQCEEALEKHNEPTAR
jgi:hypothetical protein